MSNHSSSQSPPVLASNSQGEAEPSGAWRPIETAPQHGEEIIVAGQYPNGFRYVRTAFRAPQGHYYGLRLNPPTHWMPLPAPPESGEADGALERQDGQLRDEPNV